MDPDDTCDDIKSIYNGYRSSGSYLVEHVPAEQHLEHVVEDDNSSQVHRFSVSHVQGAKPEHEEQVGDHHSQRGKRVEHEGEVSGAGICKGDRIDGVRFEGLKSIF